MEGMLMRNVRSRGQSFWVPASLVAVAAVAVALVAAGTGGGATAQQGTTITIGVMSTCKGPFAPFYEATLLGAAIAGIEQGGTPVSKKPSDFVKGLTIGGHPIRFVKGCSDATPDVALAEARRLVEQVKVDILIGPLSGSEGIAIANYSKRRPNNTFVNGTSGAQDTTLKVRSPNFYRFHTDGAQWMAGLGDYAYNTLKWRTVVTIGDDYDFPYTQNAGFVAEFCSLGGKISKRIWPPLGTKDYSSYIAQIPKSGIDGFFLTVGGTGTVAFVKEYEQLQSGNLSKKILFGSVALDPIVVEQLGERVVGGVTGSNTAPDSRNAVYKKYVAQAVKHYPALGAGAAASLFSANYWGATWPVIQALKNVGGDLSGGQKKFRAALTAVGNKGFNTPEGVVKLDQNRNAIGSNYLIQLTGLPGKYKTLRTIPNVSQSFSGFFTTKTPTPSRNQPGCVKRTPPSWVGKYKQGPPK
jgi:branched-chain amino acid transport system substrate-binding protein